MSEGCREQRGTPPDPQEVAGPCWPPRQLSEEGRKGDWRPELRWGLIVSRPCGLHQLGVKMDTVLDADSYSKIQNSSSNVNHVS